MAPPVDIDGIKEPWIILAYLAPVTGAATVFVVYPIRQGSFSDSKPLGISGTFNFMLVFGGSLFYAIHGSLVTSSLLEESKWLYNEGSYQFVV